MRLRLYALQYNVFPLLQSHLLVSHAAELAAVQKRYTSATRHIGLAHRQAQKVELVHTMYNIQCTCTNFSYSHFICT